MTATFVDTNVFLDLVTKDSDWGDWSASQLGAAMTRGRLLINEVIYAELSVRFDEAHELNDMLTDFLVTIESTPKQALFDAGKAFRRYRDLGGRRTGVLPDFFIGAHAAVAAIPLLTRDAKRYRTYFPTLSLITP